MHFSLLTRMKGTGQNAVLYTGDAGDVTPLFFSMHLGIKLS